MEKQLFYKNLHKELAEKYKTNKSTVGFIRSYNMGLKKSIPEMLLFLRQKIKTLKKHPNFKPEHKKYKKYIEMLKFINRNQDTIEKITIKTKFDK